MRDVTATEASRRFSELLDAVEHERETLVIRRHGRVVARLQPAGGNGTAVRSLLHERAPDPSWASELTDLRSLPAQERAWND